MSRQNCLEIWFRHQAAESLIFVKLKSLGNSESKPFGNRELKSLGNINHLGNSESKSFGNERSNSKSLVCRKFPDSHSFRFPTLSLITPNWSCHRATFTFIDFGNCCTTKNCTTYNCTTKNCTTYNCIYMLCIITLKCITTKYSRTKLSSSCSDFTKFLIIISICTQISSKKKKILGLTWKKDYTDINIKSSSG